MSFIIVTGGLTLFGTLVMCAVPIFAFYSFFFYPIIIIVLVRLHQRDGKVKWLPILLGGIILSFQVLPFTGISQTIVNGESQFEQEFGPDYMDLIPDSVKSNFTQTPFSLWRMLNNHANYDCNFTKNCGPYLTIPGYNDKFYFDYYSPKKGTGPFPTIINIHGGAWVIGNKGAPENRPMESRYLASRGYCVFDIQYGLGRFPEDSTADGALSLIQSFIGRPMLNKSYTIPEIAVQILGNFTDYLVAHATKYKVNTSCIYVTGGSAGAHLAGLFLGWNNTYRDIFNQTLKLKGLILFYCPANMTHLYYAHVNDPLNMFVDLNSHMADIFGGTPENNKSLFDMISPVKLVDESAPPCLILHGEKDNMVPFIEAVQLKLALNSVGAPAVFIRFPFQGHAFDFSYNTPGGQISMYFMERFLAATQYCL
ncbi:MAG: prolyl oligopeptidase family serine peptidase [Candidatus Helarchaeota archaeon]